MFEEEVKNILKRNDLDSHSEETDHQQTRNVKQKVIREACSTSEGEIEQWRIEFRKKQEKLFPKRSLSPGKITTRRITEVVHGLVDGKRVHGFVGKDPYHVAFHAQGKVKELNPGEQFRSPGYDYDYLYASTTDNKGKESSPSSVANMGAL